MASRLRFRFERCGRGTSLDNATPRSTWANLQLAALVLCLALAALPFPDPAHALPAPAASRPSQGSQPADRRALWALGLTASYAALGTWMWFAWYADQPSSDQIHYGGDGWFGERTYAGGADKLGHVWANLALSRLGTELLVKGGWERTPASLISASLSFAAFALVEWNDGYYTELSPGDLSANAVGAALAVAMSHGSNIDDAIDFRAQWLPSKEFLRHPGPNFAEDYSGQTYLLAYKPRSLPSIRRGPAPLRWMQFVNPVLGFQARHYKPAPRAGEGQTRQQVLFVGLTLDLQAMIDTQARTSSTRSRLSRALGHAVFEVLNPPLSTAPVLTFSRTPR